MSDSVYFHETTKTYEIPLRNLDFKYIRECNNVPELEKILKTLRSGEVGRFKELEEFCEDKLGQLDPENRLLRKAIPLGTLYQLNDQDREDVLTELQEWLSEMRQEENEACGMKYPGVEEMVSRVKERMGLKDKHEIEEEEAKVIEYDGSLPPVRRELCFKANSQSATRSSSCAADSFAGKRVIKPRDFREWDKLEKEWDKELNEESSVPQNAVTDHVNEKGEQMTLSESETRRISKLSCTDLAKRAESMPEQTRRQLATREKEKGNEAFRAGDYNEALLYYKRSLTLFPTSAVYNNRALIHLHRKEWSLAAKDCARVLREEPDNSKALFRSGRANYELHNLDEAERVLERLTDQDPTFTKAQNLLRTVRVEKSKRQTRKLQGGRRLVITDVGDSSDSSDEELPKLETVDPLSTSSIPIKCSAPSTKGPLSNQKITHTADLVSPVTSDSQLAPVVAIEPPNTDSDNTKPNHNYRVRRRVVYPPSSPGREGMVIEELSDTELEREKQQESETVTTDENKARTQAGVKVDEKETEFVTNSGDVTSSDQVNNLNYEDAKRCGAESRAKGDLEEAFRCYTHCIEVSRTDNESDRLAAAYRNRAIVALDMGRYQYVVDDCTEALNLQPGHPTSLYRRALGRRKLGDLMGAVIDLEEAHKLLPSSVNIKTALETSRRMLQSNSQHDVRAPKMLVHRLFSLSMKFI
ncbi:Sperm-associated antigen 1 [Fasciola hepatica]|uniref:Sperm-associated antigen 1 n=1 Tax=Fasciola hepatica TaxID=6192 RepID=A0A4E0RDX5_FASHE|nr:Sperm-associated antigen 1 [Fasciola hepatica]